MEKTPAEYVKGILEAILFTSDKPVTLDQFVESIETISRQEAKQALTELSDEYIENERGIMIVEIAGGYQMLSNPGFATYLREFYKTKVKEKLSRPALETLAIIAYKQPVSRADIELIRGVNSDGVVNHLLSKGLIKITGRKEIPGRPYIYGTTKLFLEYFGLKSLKDLPALEDIPELPDADARNIALQETETPQSGGEDIQQGIPETGGEDAVKEEAAGPEAPEEQAEEPADAADPENPLDLKNAISEIGQEHDDEEGAASQTNEAGASEEEVRTSSSAEQTEQSGKE